MFLKNVVQKTRFSSNLLINIYQNYTNLNKQKLFVQLSMVYKFRNIKYE
jgi:hypothetical protein